MHAIVNGRIVLSDKILDGCALLFDKNIIGIVSRETLDTAWADGQSWKGKPLDITDAGGNYVAPGFINLHIHDEPVPGTDRGDVVPAHNHDL